MADEKRKTVPPWRPGEGGQTFEPAASRDKEVVSLHEQLLREKQEPSERFMPMPLYLVFIISALSFWAGIYLIKYSAGFDPMAYNETLNPAEMANLEPPPFDPMRAGSRFYANNCAVCHQANGGGIPGQFPPVAASDWVQGSEERLIKILLHGMEGPIVVNGNEYNGLMPAFGGTSNDRDIAAVLTWLRTSAEMNNNATPISEEAVTAIRDQFPGRTAAWQGSELQDL